MSAKDNKERALRTWVETKIDLAKKWIDESRTQTARGIVRGAVHKCQLGENIGAEQGEYRPVLVVSNDTINSTSGNVSVVPLTKSLKKKAINGKEVPKYKSHYFLTKDKYPFLEHTSSVLGEEVKTVSKIRLGEHLGNIDESDMNKIITRVKWVLGI